MADRLPIRRTYLRVEDDPLGADDPPVTPTDEVVNHGAIQVQYGVPQTDPDNDATSQYGTNERRRINEMGKEWFARLAEMKADPTIEPEWCDEIKRIIDTAMLMMHAHVLISMLKSRLATSGAGDETLPDKIKRFEFFFDVCKKFVFDSTDESRFGWQWEYDLKNRILVGIAIVLWS